MSTTLSTLNAGLSFNEWMKANGRSPWVIARRTARIVRRYGEDVTCLSRQRYDALEAEFKAYQRAYTR